MIPDPTNGADRYNHRFSTLPESTAGATDLIGFIEAPEINERKKISKPTIEPIAMPLRPLRPL